MCLIGVRVDDHPHYQLMVAANRDEMHDRPTEAAGFWPDQPHILAGKDLSAGGTWLGMTLSGRFAAVTNIQGQPAGQAEPSSRGRLVTDFLNSELGAYQWAQALSERSSQWAGFHLLVYDGQTLIRISQDRPQLVARLSSGTHALSNHPSSDAGWEKCATMRRHLSRAGGEPTRALSELMHALEHDREEGPKKTDPSQIRQRSFIHHPQYGTRCATALLITRDGTAEFLERRFDPEARMTGETHRSFAIENSAKSN